MTINETDDVAALYDGVKRILDLEDEQGRKVGNCQRGVYLFYDYDGEPIYVGQTSERLRTRIRRHLTNQRTDAVAMRVLDPFEVAEIEMWPFWGLSDDVKETLNRAEFTVYERAIRDSEFDIILNEKEISEADRIALPTSVRAAILPTGQRGEREHPDIRLARRARTIADLARVISERQVSTGIRRTLWAQSQRLEQLARRRLESFDDREEETGPTAEADAGAD
ncbi:MAG: GIY-YIG nuclease family protein [Chloroflexota bacterium]|nr:GIY-YIG nuclease family protein [Chloroflexota bacterium]MDE2896379.1 GIY-YIG nuclease family protein [Chloroflexota bacterium]